MSFEVNRDREKAALDRVLKNMRGYDLLQIGDPNTIRFSENARFMRTFFLDSHVTTQCGKSFIQANPDCLPIQSEAIDIVLLLHQFDSKQDAMDILQEAYRVLRPNGQLIIVDLNRWSVWRLWYRSKKCYSPGKIKRCLRALDFEMTQYEKVWRGIFMLVATKNISGMTPLFIRNYGNARTCEIK